MLCVVALGIGYDRMNNYKNQRKKESQKMVDYISWVKILFVIQVQHFIHIFIVKYKKIVFILNVKNMYFFQNN